MISPEIRMRLQEYPIKRIYFQFQYRPSNALAIACFFFLLKV